MTTKRQDTKDHHCGLSDEPDDILNTYIEKGILVDFRRKLKRYTMVSPKHPLCTGYITSLNLLRLEEQRHLIRHYNMIHPFSMFHFYWRIYMSIILFETNFIWPSIASYLSPIQLNKVFALSNASFLVLIVISFLVGYHDKGQNFVILNPRRVALHYLTSYFIFDLTALGPVVVRFFVDDDNWNYGGNSWTHLKILSWILPLFKFARYPYLLETLREMKLYFGINHYFFNATIAFLNFIVFVFFTMTIIFVIMGQFSQFDNRSHLDCVKSSVAMILMVSHGYHKTDHMADKIFPIVCITFGFVVHLLIYVFIMQIWYQIYSTENKQISVYNSIGAFMRYKALPLEMRERIFLYLDFKYQRHFYKDSSIIRATSPFLRKEILIKISKESTQMVEIFKKIPERVLEKLRAHLISVIFLPGDTILKAGSRGKNMFFIKNGTVRVTTSDGKEVCRLRDGAHFGEIALVANLPRVANVTAVTACEIYILHRVHFLEVLKHYPILMTELKTMAMQRIAGIHYHASFDADKVTSVQLGDWKKDEDSEALEEINESHTNLNLN